MKKTLFATFLALIAFCLVGCEGSNENGLAKPQGLRVHQNGETLVLEWNAVKNADEYSLSKNGYYWQMTSATTVTDYDPKEGSNTYEVVAVNKNEESEPATVSYYYEKSGGGGEETPAYYIKHPWGNGSDNSWEWKPMTKEGNNYTYTGEWGGVGANINTVADDSGADWFAASSISGASRLSIGTSVKFIYNPSASSLSVEGNQGGGGGQQETSAFYIKHPWGGSDWTWQPMTKNGNNYTYTGVWGGVGANINSSASDSGAEWYEKSKISGASSVSEGETVTFTFVSSNGPVGSLSVSKNGGGGGGSTSKPSTPTNVSASVSSSCIEVTWSSVSEADSYNVYRATSASGTYSYKGNTSYPYYSDCSVTAGTTYYYKVTAENSAGESAKSTYASAKVPTSGGGGGSKPSTPTNLKAEASGSCIALSWNGISTASSYVVYRSTSASGTYSQLTETTHTYTSDCNVSSGVTYYYKVASKNSYGESSMSSYASASIGSSGGGSTTRPSAPTGLQAVQSGNTIQLTWNAVSNATKYYIYRNTSSSGNYTLINESYTNSYDDNYAFTSGTTYYYKVSAVNLGGGGESALSSYTSCKYQYVEIITNPPCDPSNVRVTITSATTTIKWDVDNYGTGCGKVTYRKLTFLDYTTGNSVEKTTSNDYYLLTNVERDKYVNNGYLVFFLYLSNDKGYVNWQYKCNIETGVITNQVRMY